MSTTLIKQLPDDYAEATGLAKYNRSRMPGTADRFSVAIGPDGRAITGLDEEAMSVPTAKKEEIKILRESLEKKLGKDLDAISPFWNEFQIVIYSDQPRIFNSENPLDIVSLTALIANGYAAPSKEAAYTPQYKDAQYYAYTEESEISEETSIRKQRDRAVAALLDISENKEKMLLYGQYLEGLKYNNKFSEDTLFKMLRAYIEDKDIKNSQNFLIAIKEPVEKLQTKAIVDRAIKQRLISRVSTGNKTFVYQYGQVTIGTTLEDVYRNMGLPDFAPELLNIKKDLEHK